MTGPRFLVFLFAAALIFILTGAVGLAADDYPRRDAVEFQMRGGLPNFLKKLNTGTGKDLRVAYLGGSITAAPGWRIKTLKWLQEQYPDVKLSEINAAIGGTGSDLGVFRVQQDALRFQPDLLFVEFAVNDGGADPEKIHKAMEGIARQTWKANLETDICFVYTLSLPMLQELQEGKCSRSASAMEELADFYKIPSIHFGVEVGAMEKAGALIFKGEKPTAETKAGEPMVFSTDGVHPLVDTGHELYLKAFVRSFEKIQKAAANKTPHSLGSPMRDDNWEAAKLIPLSEVSLSGDWKTLNKDSDKLARRFAKFMPEIRMAYSPGAEMSFRFKGSFVGIYDLLGPDSGQVIVHVDDKPAKTVRRFDRYCTYHRISKMQLSSDLEKGIVHSARITLDSQHPDKATILFDRNKPDMKKNPEKYSKANWYAGSVMLIGNLVE